MGIFLQAPQSILMQLAHFSESAYPGTGSVEDHTTSDRCDCSTHLEQGPGFLLHSRGSGRTGSVSYVYRCHICSLPFFSSGCIQPLNHLARDIFNTVLCTMIIVLKFSSILKCTFSPHFNISEMGLCLKIDCILAFVTMKLRVSFFFLWHIK